MILQYFLRIESSKITDMKFVTILVGQKILVLIKLNKNDLRFSKDHKSNHCLFHQFFLKFLSY